MVSEKMENIHLYGTHAADLSSAKDTANASVTRKLAEFNWMSSFPDMKVDVKVDVTIQQFGGIMVTLLA